MTPRRAVAVLAVDRAPAATPPGAAPEAFRLAMLEDVYELIAGLELVEAVLALIPGSQPAPVDLYLARDSCSPGHVGHAHC